MIFPVRLLRGTPPEHLRDALSEAKAAIIAARRAIQSGYPNARDYHTETDWTAACIDHALHDAALLDAQQHFETLQEHIADW